MARCLRLYYPHQHLIAQVFLVLLYFNESTYQVFYFFATGMIMVPYFLSAMYFCKVALKQENGLIKVVFSTLFTRSGLVFAAGISVMLATVLLLCARYLCLCQGTKGKGTKSIRNKERWIRPFLSPTSGSFWLFVSTLATGRIINPLG